MAPFKNSCVGRVIAVAFSAIVFATSTAAIAQENQEWMIKAGKEHKVLEKDVGTWDATVKVWPGPGAQAMESQGSETNELLEGGLWLVTRFKGEVIGVKFTGVGTYGYDPIEKKYIGTWVDTMTPHLMITKSDYDETTKTMTGVAEMRDAFTGEQYKTKVVSTYGGDDQRTMKMYRTGEDGQDWQVMEIQYTRKK